MKGKKEPYSYQKKRQTEKEIQIISILENEGPKRFNQLKRLTNRAPRGLSINLENLLKKRKIEKFVEEVSGKACFRTTPKGRRYFHDVFTLPLTLSGIEEEGGKFFSDYSGFHGDMWFCYLPWGIRDDLALSKEIDEKDNPITKEFVAELQHLIFKRLRSDLKQKKDMLDSKKTGTIVLGFEIDYKELVQSINHKDVLKLRKETTEPELDVFERIGLGKETNEDSEKFRAIMEFRKQ